MDDCLDGCDKFHGVFGDCTYMMSSNVNEQSVISIFDEWFAWQDNSHGKHDHIWLRWNQHDIILVLCPQGNLLFVIMVAINRSNFKQQTFKVKSYYVMYFRSFRDYSLHQTSLPFPKLNSFANVPISTLFNFPSWSFSPTQSLISKVLSLNTENASIPSLRKWISKLKTNNYELFLFDDTERTQD